MKTCSIDQASKKSGISVFIDGEYDHSAVLTVNEKLPIMERMKQMYDKIKDYIETENPDWVSIENVQYQNNFKTYQQLSQFQGVLFAYFFDKDMPFLLLEPSAWRSFNEIKGRKRADQKAAAIDKVKELYNIDVTDDEAEAILQGRHFSSIVAIKNEEIM